MLKVINNILAKLNENEKFISLVDKVCNKNRPSPEVLNKMIRKIHEEKKDK